VKPAQKMAEILEKQTLDKESILESSQRRMRDRPFACCAVMRGRQQSRAGFSISELDRALAMLWS
jgi:hypothetical protein